MPSIDEGIAIAIFHSFLLVPPKRQKAENIEKI
jgi:hypothetical protein